MNHAWPGKVTDRSMLFPVEENYNLQTEQTLGEKFPSSFREKVMKDNGGSIERSKAKVRINRK